jgi:hypothetical protein
LWPVFLLSCHLKISFLIEVKEEGKEGERKREVAMAAAVSAP